MEKKGRRIRKSLSKGKGSWKNPSIFLQLFKQAKEERKRECIQIPFLEEEG